MQGCCKFARLDHIAFLIFEQGNATNPPMPTQRP
jgi:hypothetical protein